MKKGTYDWLWGQIQQSIEELTDVVSKEERESHRLCLTYGDKTKEVVWAEYKRIKYDLKTKCYRADEMKNAKIDQHKIAACFCKALIDKKVFSFDVDDEISEKLLMINYKLAYIVSLRVIYIYLLEYYVRKGNEDCVRSLTDQKSLRVPETTISHDKYNVGREKTLALNDYYGVPFDLLTYSDMMYWIEYYNKQLLEGKIQVKPDNNE